MKRVVRVQVCPFCWIGNKQDKAEITQTLQGSSTFHLRFSYSCNYYSLLGGKDKLVACTNCLSKLNNLNFKDLTMGIECEDCHCFNFEKMKSTVPEQFPRDELTVVKNDHTESFRILEQLLPHPITWNSLICARQRSFDGLCKNGSGKKPWTKSQSEQYLKSECLNQSIANSNYELSKCRKCDLEHISYELNDPHTRHEELKAESCRIKTEYLFHKPEKMPLPEGPPIWRLENFTIKDFPSAIAHQLFLGIGKQLVTYFANRFLKLRGVLHSFGEKVDHILSLIDSLNIHFFRIQNESGSKNNPLSLTGWKCKDIMSFLTLSKWIFSFLIDTTGNDKDNKSKNMPDVNKSKIHFCDDDVENWYFEEESTQPICQNHSKNLTKKDYHGSWKNWRVHIPFFLIMQ